MRLIPAQGDSQGVMTIVVLAVFEVLAITAVGLRIWARALKRTPYCLNDYAIFVALISTSAFVGASIAAVLVGAVGQHMQSASLDQLTNLNKIFLSLEFLWSLSNTAVKISILHLYIKIFWIRRFRIVAYSVMALTICYCLVVFLEGFLLCRPFAYNWDKSIAGSCAALDQAYLSAGIINILVDAIIIVLPMPMLWKLQLPVSKKIGLSVMFGIGALILIISILRIISVRALDPLDFTYTAAILIVWSGLEPLLGILNACLPVMRPLFSNDLRASLVARIKSGSNDNYRSGDHLQPYHPSSAKSSRKKGVSTLITGTTIDTGLDKQNFRRLYDHDIPLTECIGTKCDDEDELEAQGEMNSAFDRDPINAIRVIQRWDVQTKASPGIGL